MVLQALLVYKAFRAELEELDRKDHKETKVRRDELVHLVHQDLLENQAGFLDSLVALDLEGKSDLSLAKWKTIRLLNSRSVF